MSLKVKCPGCTKMLTVPDAARGKAIKCPSCETRVPVPADDDEVAAGKSSIKSKTSAKKAGPVEDESGLASLDLRRLEDREANVCPKCGYDMDLINTDEDQEITECPQCGWDIAEGGMGEKARKKALKGPDPDKFYQGLWKNSWKFTKENYFLAFRTYGYTMAASLIMFFSIFMYLWISMWPPRYFFAFVATITAMVIPGWFWYLDTEVIKLTLERRDKFKRLNFDFFLASALGVKFFVWNIVFAGPLLLIPGLIGWSLWYFAGLPWWVGGIILSICYIPIFGLWPVSLTHMVMPIEYPAWMFWKVIPIGFRCFKALFTWFVLFMVTNLPVLLIAGVTAFFTVPVLVDYVQIMDKNAEINRAQALWTEYSTAKFKPKNLVDPATLGEQQKVEFKHELAITIGMMSWLFGGLILAFTSLFSMRANGYFAYYFRERLDLQVLAKEKKYVATLSRDPKDVKPKTSQEMFAQAGVTMLVCILIVVIFRVLFAAVDVIKEDIMMAVLNGIDMGLGWAIFAGFSVITKAAWEESPMWGLCVQWFNIAIGIVAATLVISFMLGAAIPLPFKVLLGVISMMGIASIFASFAFVIQFWDESGAGCLTAILSVLGKIILIPIAVLAFATNLLTLPKGLMDDGTAPQGAPQGPANPGMPPGQMPGQMPGGMPGPNGPAMPGGMPGPTGPAMPGAPVMPTIPGTPTP